MPLLNDASFMFAAHKGYQFHIEVHDFGSGNQGTPSFVLAFPGSSYASPGRITTRLDHDDVAQAYVQFITALANFISTTPLATHLTAVTTVETAMASPRPSDFNQQKLTANHILFMNVLRQNLPAQVAVVPSVNFAVDQQALHDNCNANGIGFCGSDFLPGNSALETQVYPLQNTIKGPRGISMQQSAINDAVNYPNPDIFLKYIGAGGYTPPATVRLNVDYLYTLCAPAGSMVIDWPTWTSYIAKHPFPVGFVDRRMAPRRVTTDLRVGQNRLHIRRQVGDRRTAPRRLSSEHRALASRRANPRRVLSDRRGHDG
jgi:hypothetical protein